MNYEIINPSDKCFIASSDREAACARVNDLVVHSRFSLSTRSPAALST